jgi:hypothetical protein
MTAFGIRARDCSPVIAIVFFKIGTAQTLRRLFVPVIFIKAAAFNVGAIEQT